jgi:hypothetical protein
MRNSLAREFYTKARRAALPARGQIWRAANGWERHVTSASASNVAYIQVVHGRENIGRNCLPSVWARWVKKSAAQYIGEHR